MPKEAKRFVGVDLGGDKKFVTEDQRIEKGVSHEADARVLADAAQGRGYVIKNNEQLLAIAEAAKATYDAFNEEIAHGMTEERAKAIRLLRCEHGYTWRALAAKSSEDWGSDATWNPPSNQIAGMVLCELAASLLGEDPNSAPWN